MKRVKSIGNLRIQVPCTIRTDLGKRRHMYADERLLVSLSRTLEAEDAELFATKAEIAEALGTCSATVARAASSLKRRLLVNVRPVADQHCATIGNSYRLTGKGVQMARLIEGRIIDRTEASR